MGGDVKDRRQGGVRGSGLHRPRSHNILAGVRVSWWLVWRPPPVRPEPGDSVPLRRTPARRFQGGQMRLAELRHQRGLSQMTLGTLGKGQNLIFLFSMKKL